MAGVVFVLSSLLLLQTVSSCPKECSCDTHAKVVDCRGRGLYDIPRKLHQDTLELYLQNNRLRGLGSMSFRETPQLQILDLANNSITTLSPSALLGLRSLKVLSLANNSIREVDRRLLVSVRNLTILDLSFNTIGGLPAAFADSFHFLTHLSLHYNRLTKLDRIHLEALDNLKILQLKGNPWRCDCHLIGLKLWLETFVFKGGVVDSVTCVQPHLMLERDLRHIPYELFHSCMITSYSYLFANIHYMDNKHRMISGQLHPSPRSPSGSDFSPQGEAILPECEPKQRARPVNYRRAIATVVITGVVCGIVCLMMLAAAVYGCAYAAINAKYQRELKKKAKEAGSGEEQKNIEREEDKEPLE
ncbi:LOW QUALITY PROTEIN: leucine-rich repeat and transmembrane domain-containing protein 1 [Carassius gibelio]|uniref:LOW QUALITY PROTEIN: leucine-rich repeat and transmembrane domain-containing protein 1 n=1 Tax=Carassius gibelio TaxID=101364 RepID=UPI002278596D|nr:LOW QUALITY PROTEIN: leucine-rich repeat and transmembrane domain-containing protein 1 [Carassius gibelio]